MKKILAFVLTLAMMLTMFNVGFIASAENEIPEGAIAIDSVEDLAAMEADKVYYLAADIIVGSPETLNVDEEGKAIADDIAVPGVEADIITIPAGVTLYGNGYAILMGYYVSNPADYTNSKGQVGPGTHSKDWTHPMFQLSAGNAINFEGISFGTEEDPIYLDRKIGTGPDGYSAWGMFLDAEESNVVWTDCDFYFDRQNGGLDNANLGPICYQILGNFELYDCTRNGYVSAGSQHGGWFYKSGSSAVLTMDGCVANGTMNGSYTGGIIHSPAGGADVTITNYTNYANFSLYYGSGTGGFWSTMIGNFGGGENGELYMENCVNYGNVTLNAPFTIGGAILGRTASSAKSIQLIDCVNYGNIVRSGASTTSNHGFGGLAGHTGALETYDVINCANYGNITNVGSCFGAILGFKEGPAALLMDGCANYGNITTVAETNEAAGIIGQWRDGGLLIDCVNYGSITGAAAKHYAGIAGRYYATADSTYTYTIENCVNYGAIGTTGATYVAGIIATKGNKLAELKLIDCVNYGKILSRQYSGGMVAEAAQSLVIDGCINYGEVAGVHAVSGMVAQVANSAITIDIRNSLNAGYIHEGPQPGEGIGGFLGRIGGTKPTILLTGCANVGTIQGSTKNSNQYGAFGDTFGQFIGAYTVLLKGNYYDGNPLAGGFYDWNADGVVKPVLTDCYAYGQAIPSEGAMSLTGWITKDEATGENFAQADCIQSEVPVTEAPNNGAYGINVQISADSTEIKYVNANYAEVGAAFLAEKYGAELVAGVVANGEAPIVKAAPAIRAYQMSLDGSAIRILATVDSSSYENVGFVYSALVDDEIKATSKYVTTNYVMKSINAVSGITGTDPETGDPVEGDVLVNVSAEELGGKYITAITFRNIPAEGLAVITLAATAGEYASLAYTIVIMDGEVLSCYVA